MTPLRTAPRPAEILLVEDNPGDVRLTKEALKGGSVPISLGVVEDGMEALSYLRREGEYTEVSRPDLILLDLNLPRMNGHEVLAEIKGDCDLKRIPVIVLSISMDEKDLILAYENHANSYINKRVSPGELREMLQAIEHFWFRVARLPPG
ncbi:MAG: response regulator [Thermoplasmata archaeon]